MSDDQTMKDGVKQTVSTEKVSNGVSDEIVYQKGLRLVAILVAVCLAELLLAMDGTIIATAIPRITDQFKSVHHIGWYGSAYFLTTTSLQPLFGRIYTTFNIKNTFLGSIAIFELGSLICGVAPSSVVLIIGRLIAGIGVGGVLSGEILIATHALPLAQRPMAFGLIGSMWGIALIAGPLLGGAFADTISWRWCFYIKYVSMTFHDLTLGDLILSLSLPVGAISAIVIYFSIKISEPSNTAGQTFLARIRQLDLLGAFVLLPAVVCLLLALQWGGSTYAWGHPRIIGLFVGFGCLSILFIVTQVKLGDRATIPPRILAQRTVLASVCFSIFFCAGFFVLVFYFPLYFQSIKGLSATKSGIHILPFLIATVLSSVASGFLIGLAGGYYTPFLIVGTVIFAIGPGLISTYSIHISFARRLGYQILAGAGVGFGFQIPFTAIQTVLPMQDIPIGSACLIFFQSLGGALFVSVAQAIFENGIIRGLRTSAPTLDPQLLIKAGATEIRSLLSRIGKPELLPAVLEAYMMGLVDSYRVVVACTSASAIAACFLEWRSVKDATTTREPEAIIPSVSEV